MIVKAQRFIGGLLICVLTCSSLSISISNVRARLIGSVVNGGGNACALLPVATRCHAVAVGGEESISSSQASAPPASGGGGVAAAVLNPFLESLMKPVNPGKLSLYMKGKVLNMWGIVYALSCLMFAVLVLPFMILSSFYIDTFGSREYRKTRTVLDWIVHVWAKLVMMSTGCTPTVYGLENLPPKGEPVIYVPNHTSFMDILTFSGFVPRPFKYLSKEEIVKLPIIGYAMKLAQHVFLKRNDLESTIQVTNSVIEKLENKNSMVLFAEGTRSKDGILKSFKKGAFQMAKAANVRIVPVSMGNLHRFMPPSAMMPIAPLRNIYIKIHKPIETDDKPVSELRAETWEAVNSGLPPYQQGTPSKRQAKKQAAD